MKNVLFSVLENLLQNSIHLKKKKNVNDNKDDEKIILD